MKILYITNGITGSGGLERVLSVKTSVLAEDFGYEVYILSLNEIGKEPFFSFSDKILQHSIKVVGNPIRYFLGYKNGIQKKIDEIQPDVISVCDDGLKGFTLPKLIKTSAIWIYERHVSKLIEAKSDDHFRKRIITKCKWLLMEKLGENFSKFIVLTEGNKKEWKSLINLEVIPNPLSFFPEEISPLDQKKVLCVGKISYQKGQDLLLKAWDIVWQKHPDWKLEFYGKNDKQRFNSEDLNHKNIHHFPPEKNIQDKYLVASIYVMPSRFEGFGMVLIEAMACGLPCVSFDCHYGPADIIRNNEDGFLVENGNTDALAKQILMLVENNKLRVSMGIKAKENVARFAPEIIAKQWDELFKALKK